ncbi:hypothetical protein Xmir_03040 [Xenorhabdus miraniensis]|uniref:Uncharacterized protein n=1 Tax=Xenorhabdus miraniensis TaxID=351674 RepID=A0A2D0JN29_9GAMM|nr:hypothetical protein Xmir_03040 [Xenorhabdus miraniensis]
MPYCPVTAAPDDLIYRSALMETHPDVQKRPAPYNPAKGHSGGHAGCSPALHPCPPPSFLLPSFLLPNRPPAAYPALLPAPAPPIHAPPGVLPAGLQFPPVQYGSHGFSPADHCGPEIPDCRPAGNGLNPRYGTGVHPGYH